MTSEWVFLRAAGPTVSPSITGASTISSATQTLPTRCVFCFTCCCEGCSCVCLWQRLLSLMCLLLRSLFWQLQWILVSLLWLPQLQKYASWGSGVTVRQHPYQTGINEHPYQTGTREFKPSITETRYKQTCHALFCSLNVGVDARLWSLKNVFLLSHPSLSSGYHF